MENRAYLGIGSNKGDKLNYLKRAVAGLNQISGSKVTNCSSVYETAPYGDVIQENYYNAVCGFKTGCLLPELFEILKELEINLGRKKSVRWGAREIDIDILLYNDLIYTDERLIVPHKELVKRDFVVVPLLELDPFIIHPELKIKLSDIKFKDSEKYIINKLDGNLLKTVGD